MMKPKHSNAVPNFVRPISLLYFLIFSTLMSCQDDSNPNVADNESIRDTEISDLADIGNTFADVGISVDATKEQASDAEPPRDVSDSDGQAKIRFATWNIYYLDKLGEGDQVQRTAEDYVRLKKYVTELDADVIALQEIRGVDGVRTLFDELDWDVACENRNSSQNVCIVVRKSSQFKIERHPDLESIRRGNPGLRAGVDITVARPGYQDIRILAVHLKSDCFIGTTADGCEVYFNQIVELEKWIDARAETEQAFMVMGDFNRFLTADDSAWLEINDGQPARSTLKKSIAEGNAPCWGGMFFNYVDHLILGDQTQIWLTESEQIVFEETDFEANYQTLSDHCPIWADLLIPTIPLD